MKDLLNDELLIRYLTETATVEENATVEQWYAQSDENQKTLEQMYFTLQASNCLKVVQSANHEQALLQLKDKLHRKEKTRQRQIVLLRLQRVAAMLFLPLLLLSGWLILHRDEVQAQYVELHSNPGMVTSFELPDGSKVWLDGGSRLRYPSAFKGHKREVEMSGQGYFEIAHNALQPFLVKTGKAFSLEVLGTSFNLSAYEDEDIIETTLVKGSVRLNMMQNSKMVEYTMKPNEKIVYIKNQVLKSTKIITAYPKNDSIVSSVSSKSVTVTTVDPKYDIAWKDNQLLFKNHPIEQVIRTLGRYYNVQFVVKNEKVLNSQITGKFSNEQLSQVMEYLKIASGIKYNIIPATVSNGEIKPEVIEIWK